MKRYTFYVRKTGAIGIFHIRQTVEAESSSKAIYEWHERYGKEYELGIAMGYDAEPIEEATT